MLSNATKIIIQKNRGWRGLAEIKCYDKDDKLIHSMIFSFSQPVWDDLMAGNIVTQDKEYYYVLEINSTSALPQGQQRSVLIKNFNANIINVHQIQKSELKNADAKDYNKIYHFQKNRNNHTQSDWNYIGVRVTPNI